MNEWRSHQFNHCETNCDTSQGCQILKCTIVSLKSSSVHLNIKDVLPWRMYSAQYFKNAEASRNIPRHQAPSVWCWHEDNILFNGRLVENVDSEMLKPKMISYRYKGSHDEDLVSIDGVNTEKVSRVLGVIMDDEQLEVNERVGFLILETCTYCLVCFIQCLGHATENPLCE